MVKQAITYLLILIFIFSIGNFSNAQNSGNLHPTDYQVMAAFLYNFTKFIEWSDVTLNDSTPSFVIGVYGKNPFGDYLKEITKNKLVKNKPIEVKKIVRYRELKSCHILFISNSEKEDFERILKRVEKLNILTVSDIDRFAQYGGIVNFVIENNKVSFIINIEAATRASITMSSKLLKLAKVIRHSKDWGKD